MARRADRQIGPKRWLALKERETGRWFIHRPTERYTVKERRFSGPDRTVGHRYKKYVTGTPEKESPFIEDHMIVEGDTIEEAQAQCPQN